MVWLSRRTLKRTLEFNDVRLQTVTASGQTPQKRIIDSSQGFVAGIQNFTKNLTVVAAAEAAEGCEKKEGTEQRQAKGAWNDYVGIACRDNGSLRYNGFQEAHDDSKRVEAADSELRSQIQEYIDTEDGSIDEIDDHIRLIDSQRKRNSLDTWQKYKAYYAERRAPGHESPDNE